MFYGQLNICRKYSWYDDVLFNGKSILATKIGWSYIPVWFGISVPIFYLIVDFGGFISIMINFIRMPKLFLNNTIERNNLLYNIIFFTPLLAAIIIKHILFDGWATYDLYLPLLRSNGHLQIQFDL